MANTDSRCARKKVRSISSLASLAWPVPTSYPFGRKSQNRVPEGSATRATRPRPWSAASVSTAPPSALTFATEASTSSLRQITDRCGDSPGASDSTTSPIPAIDRLLSRSIWPT